MCYWFFFFKQKTAYEVRISDWSSDVCSSDPRAGQRWCRRGRGHGFWRRYPCRSWRPSPVCLRRIAGSWWICCAGPGSEPSVLSRISRPDRKSVVSGQSVSVRVDLGGSGSSTKKKNNVSKDMLLDKQKK